MYVYIYMHMYIHIYIGALIFVNACVGLKGFSNQLLWKPASDPVSCSGLLQGSKAAKVLAITTST